MALTISDLASRVGVRPDTLRYYERIGLLTPTERTPTRYRVYDEELAQRLRFIKGAQRLGLRLRDIKEILDIRDRGHCPCGHTRELLDRRIAEVEQELARLHTMHRQLVRMVERGERCPDGNDGVWWCEEEFAKEVTQ